MPRFVLLEHDHPTPHFDLLFEVGEVLWAWRLDRLPEVGEAVAATRNFDHRHLYLEYEGPISGGRGRVSRVDRGEYRWIEQSEARLEAEVRGERMRGRMVLTHTSGECWTLTYHAAGQGG